MFVPGIVSVACPPPTLCVFVRANDNVLLVEK